MEAFYFYLERENGKFLKSHLNVFYLSLKQAHIPKYLWKSAFEKISTLKP